MRCVSNARRGKQWREQLIKELLKLGYFSTGDHLQYGIGKMWPNRINLAQVNMGKSGLKELKSAIGVTQRRQGVATLSS